jgi:hypothetical protein
MAQRSLWGGDASTCQLARFWDISCTVRVPACSVVSEMMTGWCYLCYVGNTFLDRLSILIRPYFRHERTFIYFFPLLLGANPPPPPTSTPSTFPFPTLKSASPPRCSIRLFVSSSANLLNSAGSSFFPGSTVAPGAGTLSDTSPSLLLLFA